MLSTSLASLFGSAPVLAQVATAPAEAEASAATDTQARTPASDIIVTGSRIARKGFDAPTPMTVADSQELKLSGQVNVERSLLELPQVTLGGTNAFSNQVSATGGGFADLNLRGLGSNRNLVLVNGRRFAIVNPSQITDVNTIPQDLIERVEIVTGGSSAVYGSDAIAGVSNFILKDHFTGLKARSQVNLVEHSRTPTFSADLTGGVDFAEGRGNIAVSLNYLNRKANTRGDFQWSPFSYNLGESCVVAGTGTATLPGQALTVPAGQTCQQAGGMVGYIFSGSNDIPNGRIYGLPAPGGANAALNAAYVAAGIGGFNSTGITFNDAGTVARAYAAPGDSYNINRFNSLQNGQRRYMGNAFAHFDVSDALKTYGEFHFSHNRVFSQVAPVNYSSPFVLNVDNPYLSPQIQTVLRLLDSAETGRTTITQGPASFSTTPNDGLAVVSLARRFAEVGPRSQINTRDVYRGMIGFRGDIGSVSERFLTDLKYDAYYSLSRSSETIKVFNGVSKTAFQQSLLRGPGGASPLCNMFGQNLSAACVAAIRTDAEATTRAKLQVGQASLAGSLFPLPAGPVGFSIGAEWRKTDGRFLPGPNLVAGDVAGYAAILPTRGSVTAKEVFGEVRVPLIHDTFLIKSLSANAGARISDYSLSGVGTVTTYFYGVEWQVTRDLNFRGQYQRAIRAPSVGELFAGQVNNFANANDPCSSRAATAQQTAEVRALCVATGVPAANVFTLAVQPQSTVFVLSGGNPNLDAETAKTYTAGLVLTPHFIPRLSLSVDYYDIAVSGAIGQLGGGVQNIMNLCYYVTKDASSSYCNAIPRNATTGEVLISGPIKALNANTGGIKTRGVDFSLAYRLPLDTGLGLAPTSSLAIRSTFSRLLKFNNTPVQDLPVVNECVGSFGNSCGDPKPKWRGSNRVTWTVGDFSLSLQHRYIGPVTTDRYLVPLRQGAAATPSLASLAYPRIGAQNYFDLSFTLLIAKQMEIYAGANNLTNRDMPNITSPGFYDPMGRELFLGVSVTY
jgi:outer membrane receptor protein involved in Fe transport